MTLLTVDTTTILIAPIEAIEGLTRRQCERAIVSRLLCGYFCKEVELKHDSDGAPLLDACNISISHSRRLAVVALDTHNRIGVDAEEWREALYRVKDKFLSDDELKAFSAPEQLLAAWTIKEAVYKVVGREATEFASAIAINSDMTQAQCLGCSYDVWSTDVDNTHITLAKKRL